MLLTFIFTDESRFVFVLWVAGIRSLSGGHGSSTLPSLFQRTDHLWKEHSFIHSFISLSNLASNGIIFNWKLNHPFYLACQKAWPTWTWCSSTQVCYVLSWHPSSFLFSNKLQPYWKIWDCDFFFSFHCLVFVVCVEIILSGNWWGIFAQNGEMNCPLFSIRATIDGCPKSLVWIRSTLTWV